MCAQVATWTHVWKRIFIVQIIFLFRWLALESVHKWNSFRFVNRIVCSQYVSNWGFLLLNKKYRESRHLTFIFSFPCPQALLGIAQVLRLSTVNYTALLSGYFPVPASQIHRLFSLGRQEQPSHIYLVLLLCLLIICFTLSWNNIEANIKAADTAPGRLFIVFALSVLT